ncbi:SPOR domain-containing protein [Paraglaciecola sp. MB-3u-78]|uniref:SPOR domain-containing protein n=1 Tax=Paraglaciecola sp. MB-3u-78 TaxID=2058332 RepID=UPI000C339DB4|nr:SPOR domain-containing protein [Paraglaciecola sp. MB-3u-78]PKG99940.1 DamX protein [Paraglaciecola sp. MB-3u-78]
MAASELNNRLDYLISYSSQLVFVCSDKIQQQSQVVENFLAHKNEQADLALLTANELTPLVIYREKLFRQLVSQSQTADFNRPLNQLLEPLNNHNGPILISVFQAEKLPIKLVKELWDLVLQSRFANNKQHLNVLLMGLSDWAESARSCLGAKSKHQPIVLTNQSDIQPAEDHEFSDLESFIQDKRKKFAQRIEDRNVQSYEAEPIYKKWWMATLFGLVFLTIFTGILGWHYPEKVNVIWSYINIQVSPQEQPVEPSDVAELADESVATITTQAAPQSVEVTVVPEVIPNATKVGIKELLVTDWSTASGKLEEQSNKVLLQSSNIDEKVDTPTQLSLIPKQPAVVEDLKAQTDTVNDYQVVDKVTYAPISDQKGEPLGNTEQVKTADFLKPDPDMLLALPNKNYVIQIAAMANISILQDYVRDEQLGQQLWLYKTQRYGGDWYVLLKNQHFSTIEAARAEIINLPEAMLKNTPFVKSIGQVKQEISVSEA